MPFKQTDEYKSLLQEEKEFNTNCTRTPIMCNDETLYFSFQQANLVNLTNDEVRDQLLDTFKCYGIKKESFYYRIEREKYIQFRFKKPFYTYALGHMLLTRGLDGGFDGIVREDEMNDYEPYVAKKSSKWSLC